MVDLKIWYVRRREQIRGPFAYSVLAKLAKLGRLKPTDEVSDNKHEWSPASSHAELFTLTNAEIQLKDEERNGLDRRENDTAAAEQGTSTQQTHRRGKDRRKPESEEVVRRRKERTILLHAIREGRVEDHFPKFAIVASVALIVLIAVVLTPSSDEQTVPDCEALPQPGVNWDNCQLMDLQAGQSNLSESSIRNAILVKADLQFAILVKSNLSYSNLSGSNLANAQLNNATLKGTNLRSVNLHSASLRSADLSYADLRNADLQDADLTLAILDKVIWINGKLCAQGSIGRCQ